MTPDQIKILFDANAIIIMFAWGILCKYIPALAKIPNQTIPYVNLVGYIATKLAVPDAHAGVLDGVPAAVGCLVGGFTNAIWARQLFEGFGRPLLERWLKLKKA